MLLWIKMNTIEIQLIKENYQNEKDYTISTYSLDDGWV